MTPDHEDNRPSVVPQPAKDVWNPPMPDHTNPVPQPPIFVPPESETRPEAATEADLRVARHICKWAYGYYRGGSAGASEAYAYWEGTAKDWPGTIAEINRWAYDIRAHVAAETAGLRALIVKQSEALKWALDNMHPPFEWEGFTNGHAILALTPKDLEDCVVVKRSEWERLQTLSEKARKSP